MSESKTPRTDAATFLMETEDGDEIEVVRTDFARQLETELSTVLKESATYIGELRGREMNLTINRDFWKRAAEAAEANFATEHAVVAKLEAENKRLRIVKP